MATYRLLLLHLFLASAAAFSWRATSLTVNGMHDLASFPLGSPLVLSWLPEPSDPTLIAEHPIRYHEVSLQELVPDPQEGALEWSVLTASSSSSLVLPAEVTQRFRPLGRYAWRVSLHSNSSSEPSAPARLDISPSEDQWANASWIGGGSQLRTDWELPAGSLSQATAYVSGVGAFEFHVNGKKVGDHFSDPGEAVFDQKVLFVTFDVTSLLNPGTSNAIGGLIGNSKFGYLDIYANRSASGDQSGDSTRAFRVLINATMSTGEVVTLGTDPSSWYYRHGPIVYDHLWHGEIYDQRQELSPAWDLNPVSSYPPNTWLPAKPSQQKLGSMFPAMFPPIREIASWNAAPKQSGTGLLWDFTQNMAGFSTLSFVAPAGAGRVIKLVMTHAEVTNSTGIDNYYYPGMENNYKSKTCSMPDWYANEWYECANQTDAYIFTTSDTATQHQYTPTFTYHGFRFVQLEAVEITASGAQIPLREGILELNATITAHRVNSDLQQVSSVQMSGAAAESIQQIFNATLAAHVSQLWSIPTDCPQREKRGWMGDAGITSASLSTFYDSFAFHANFLRLIVDNQQKGCTDQPKTTIDGPCTHEGGDAATFYNGSVPDVVPYSTGPYGGNPGTTDWQATFVTIARNSLRQYGDLAKPLLEEIYPNLQLFMEYLERLVDPSTGLLLQGARGDWIPPSPVLYTTPTNEVSAFFQTLLVGYMSEIAEALGHDADAATYKKRYAANIVAYHSEFFNNHSAAGSASPRCCYSEGSQTSNVFALQLGAVPAEYINATIATLASSIRNRTATTPSNIEAALSGSQNEADHTLNQVGSWAPGAHMDVGIFGTTWLFEVLMAHGQEAVGLEILMERSYPSFGFMLDGGDGAEPNGTTLWEGWEALPSTESRNHIMFGGGVNLFIASAVAGLSIESRPLSSPSRAGWRHMLVRPAPAAVRLLSSSSTQRRTPIGVATVSWERNTSGFHLTVSIPVGATASVAVPLLDASEVELGSCHLQCEELELDQACVQLGVSSIPVCPGRHDGEKVMLMEVEAGSFAFHAR
eukprot:TRINITY_DN17984_c0_g1_i2.p1 TRINITY_DN17984_c0_g1~~TRINITY_DN17984_c0_g1_i2.p1  ORF type:complete len:1040 (-),score=151.32 TRINITY_DN17984_c0_g1_i2:119-3238(-)